MSEIHPGRRDSFRAIQNPPETVTLLESESTYRLDTEYRESYPQGKFGEVSITLADVKGFVSPFEKELEAGYQAQSSAKGDEFLKKGAEEGLGNIYVVKAGENSPIIGNEQKAWEHHQPQQLAETVAKLEALKAKIDEEYADVEPLFRSAYRDAIDSQLEFCANAARFGSPEYTKGQRTEESWARLIDVQKSREAGEVVLVHEELAVKTLERGMDMTPDQTRLFRSVGAALDFWKFSEEERAVIVGDEEIGAELTPQQGVRLFDALKRRLGMDDWKIEMSSGTKAISVNANMRRVSYPDTRTLTPDEAVLLPVHELGTHVVSGENGDKQPCPILRTGMPEYISTQEGLATISEMIAGEPFGHPRQRLFAARYLAAAMSLKTIETENGRKPKHTVQEIYNTLRRYNVGEKDAAQTVWRLVRGTSLTRQVVDVEIGDDETFAVAETFAKDVAYFEGFVKIREFFMQTVPLLKKEVNEKGEVVVAGREPDDFSSKLLARIGRAIAIENVGAGDSAELSYETMKTVYAAYVDLGRSALMDIMQYMLVGKMRFQDMTQESPWNQFLVRKDLIQFKDLFNPSQ